MEIDTFLTINFVNKNVQEYRSNINPRDLKNLFSLYEENENLRNKSNEKILLKDLSQEKEFKKVASQIQFIGYDKDYCMIFGIYGPNIERNNKDYLVFILEKITEESCFNINKNNKNPKNIEKRKTSGVSLVFFNNFNNRRKNMKSGKRIFEPIKIDDFKDEIVKNIRFKYLSRINHILLIFPSFINKSWGYLSSFGFKDGFYRPLFDYSKLDKNLLSKEEYEISKLSLYSNEQITQSIEELHFQQEFESNFEQDEDNTFFTYHTKIEDYLEHPQSGLFRKVADKNELRKLENRILSYEEDDRNINLGENEFTLLISKIKGELKLFGPETITSFIKKLFTQLQNPIFPNEVYTQITSLSWSELEKQLKNYETQKISYDGYFRERNFEKSLEPPLIDNGEKTQNNVKQKIAFFESLSQKKFIMSNSKNYSINSSFISNESSTNQKPIRFRKISHLSSTKKEYNEKLKNNDFLKLDEMKNNFPHEFYLLKETIKLLNKVTKEEKFNLMSAKNLAICFNPCFFRSSSEVNKKITRSVQEEYEKHGKLVHVIEKMIEKPEDFFETV